MAEPALDVEALYRRYGPMVVRRCRQLLRHEEEAADVAQEVVVNQGQGADHLVLAPRLLEIATRP